MRILIVEDDTDISRQLSTHLEECGFLTHISSDGEEGLFQGREENFDAVLLDIGLPGMDGFTLLEHWRREGKNIPVIIVTARSHKMETIRGLEAGADDYINKPFDLDEVVARLRTNIRRHKGQLQQTASYKNVTFDFNAGRISVDNIFVKLTRIEFLMIQYLFYNQGRMISTTELSEHIYRDFDHDSSIIARHIANIRKKIGADIILTESNRGYYVPKAD